MTPQSILEDMAALEARVGDRLAELFDAQLWVTARTSLAEAVHFQFDGATPKAEHIDFANDMMRQDLFRLPFEVVLYTADVLPKTGILAFQFVEAGRLTGLMWLTLAPAIGAAGEAFAAPLMVHQLDGRDHASGAPVNLADGTVDWASVTRTRHASRTTGRPWTEADYFAASEKTLNFLMGGTALMMSKDVETRTEAAPAKLNKRREAQGRPLIRERRVVVIRPERRPAYADAAAAFAGLRASPRMHWRRGHFRTLSSGAVIPVAPALVNGAGAPVPAPKSYVVPTPRNEAAS